MFQLVSTNNGVNVTTTELPEITTSRASIKPTKSAVSSSLVVDNGLDNILNNASERIDNPGNLTEWMAKPTLLGMSVQITFCSSFVS